MVGGRRLVAARPPPALPGLRLAPDSAVGVDLGLFRVPGFGIQPPTADWGADIANSYQYLGAGYWWETLFPALAIASLVVGVILIADSIEAVLIQ